MPTLPVICYGISGGTVMHKRIGTAAAALLLLAGQALAADKDKEPSAIIEIGGASEWSLQNGAASLGPSIAVEIEPIKDWLELEAGFTPLFRKGNSPEWISSSKSPSRSRTPWSS